MTAFGDVAYVCWHACPREEILPAVGRRKRTACGRQDDTRGGYGNVCLLAFPPAGGDPPCRWQAQANALRAQDDSVRECYMCLLACPPAGGDPSPCGAQDDTRRAGQENAKKHESSPTVCHSSRHPTTSKDQPTKRCHSSRHPTTNKDQPTKRCHSEPALYAWAVRRISQLAERVRGYAASVGVHYRPRGGDPPCRWQAQANAGLRMTALGNAICVC